MHFKRIHEQHISQHIIQPNDSHYDVDIWPHLIIFSLFLENLSSNDAFEVQYAFFFGCPFLHRCTKSPRFTVLVILHMVGSHASPQDS